MQKAVVIVRVLEWQKPPSLLLHTKVARFFTAPYHIKKGKGLFPAAAAARASVAHYIVGARVEEDGHW